MRQPILILPPPLFGRPQESRGDVAFPPYFGPLSRPGCGSQIMILSSYICGSPRMQGCHSVSALFWALEKAGVKRSSDFVLLYLGIPENAALAQHFCPYVGPREGRGEEVNSDFVPILFGDPREWRGGVAFSPSFDPPRRQG